MLPSASVATKRRLEGAAYGSVGVTRVLRLASTLDKAVKKDAKAQGLTVSEWWRRAGQAALHKGKKARE